MLPVPTWPSQQARRARGSRGHRGLDMSSWVWKHAFRTLTLPCAALCGPGIYSKDNMWTLHRPSTEKSPENTCKAPEKGQAQAQRQLPICGAEPGRGSEGEGHWLQASMSLWSHSRTSTEFLGYRARLSCEVVSGYVPLWTPLGFLSGLSEVGLQGKEFRCHIRNKANSPSLRCLLDHEGHDLIFQMSLERSGPTTVPQGHPGISVLFPDL